MNKIDRRRYIWVVLSAVAQGLLLGAYLLGNSSLLPGRYSFLSCVPLGHVILIPYVFWLAQEQWGGRLKRLLVGLTFVLTAFYAYRFWSVYKLGSALVFPPQGLDLTRACLAVFLLVPFLQCRINSWRWRVPYSEIFFQLCRNVFLLLQAAIFTALFWALLLTGSLLFDIVGLDLVPHILFAPVTAITLTSLTIAISISVALKHPGIDSLGRWLLGIMAWLLPPFSLLSIMFIACLPYSGLKPLWSTGQASSLILLLQFATILLANTAWLDGTRKPFINNLFDWLSRASLLCLPIYTGICLYSLGLRINQYGLTVERIHAVFFAIITGVFGLGYAGAVLVGQWPRAIGRVNVASVLLLCALVILMNSPALDPYRLAANNQAVRLMNGQIEPQDFDYLYMRFNLGRYGGKALDRLEAAADAKDTSANAAIKKRIAEARAFSAREYLRRQALKRPEGFSFKFIGHYFLIKIG